MKPAKGLAAVQPLQPQQRSRGGRMRGVPWGCVTVSVLLAAAGCGGGARSPAASSSGLTGHTVVDVGCPLAGGDPCPTRPIRARVTITAPDSRAHEVLTDDRGAFRVPLAPGRYVLQAENLTGAPVPTALPVAVQVPDGRFAAVTIAFDSGVRRG